MRVSFVIAVLVALLASSTTRAKSVATSTSPMTFSALKAKAPKARTARRAAFLVFARSDRAALDERRQAAKAALALADGPREASARVTTRLVLAGLAAISGDEATTRTQLQAAKGEGRGLAWVDVDDDARALLACLDLDRHRRLARHDCFPVRHPGSPVRVPVRAM